MTLNDEQRDYWTQRISQKISEAIDRLCAQAEPDLRERIRSAARQRAIESLGIADSQTRLDEIKSTRTALDAEEKALLHEMAVRVRNVEPHSDDRCLHESIVQTAIRDRQVALEKEMLAADPLGQRILQLRLEDDELFDTVSLTTTFAQIKQLWVRVAEIIDQPPSELHKYVLSLEPVPDDKP
jgi:hypothetical protein